jgi:hypothetical protein
LLRLLDHEQIMLSLYFDRGDEIQQVFLSACVRYHAGVQQKTVWRGSNQRDSLRFCGNELTKLIGDPFPQKSWLNDSCGAPHNITAIFLQLKASE